MKLVRAAASSTAGLTGQGLFAKCGARKGEFLPAAAGPGGYAGGRESCTGLEPLQGGPCPAPHCWGA